MKDNKLTVGIYIYAKAWGGVEKLVEWLIFNLKNEVDFKIISPTKKEESVLDYSEYFYYKEGNINELTYLLKILALDVIYVPRSLDKTQFEVIRAIKYSGQNTRYIAGIHVPLNIFQIDASKRINPLLIYYCADCIHLISNSSNNVEYIPKTFWNKISFIENPIKTSIIQQENELNLRIVTAGRLSFEKNIPLLIQVAYELKKKNKNIGITVFGDGPEKLKLIRLSKIYGVQDYFIIKNYSDRWLETLRYGDVFVCTSYYEGYGMALAEAVASGIPGIGFSFSQGPSEILNESNGILIDAQPNYQDLLTAIEILENKKNYDHYFRYRDKDLANTSILNKWRRLFSKMGLNKKSIISHTDKIDQNLSNDAISELKIKTFGVID